MAYRKGDIPKVKLDIPNAPKFDLGDLTEPMSNMDRLFDNIAKDIRERQDNAIAMEFTKCIGELLKKNGVTPKITKYTHENVKEHSIEQLYGVSIDELDFSEHDKVFENEIAGLKAKIAIKDMDYKTASELLGKYQRENEALKKRIDELEKELEEWKEEARVVKKQRDEQLKSFRKGIEPYVDLLHMHETIAELKQHIAELEDKIGDRDEINRCLREKIEELQKENEHLTEEYKVMSDFANKQMQKNERLKCDIDKMATSKSEWIDRAVEWQQKCEKLESKESVKSMRIEFHADNGEMLTPLEVANALINQNTFKVDELRELSEFLQVYCNHHEDRDIEPSIMLF